MLSPLDDRYSAYIHGLSRLLSNEAYTLRRTNIEMKYLSDVSKILDQPVTIAPELMELDSTHYERIKEFEKETNHDVKAIEYFLREHLRKGDSGFDADNLIHIGLTSQDVNSISFSYGFKLATDLLLSHCKCMVDSIRNLRERCDGITCIARTHGEPATPMKFVDFFDMCISDIETCMEDIKHTKITAKMGGAVGNNIEIKFTRGDIDWEKFNTEFVESYGLVRSKHTSQIDSYLSICKVLSTFKLILARVKDYGKNIKRYIQLRYLDQQVVETEVGSSVMPQKVNPIRVENSLGHVSLATHGIDAYTDDLMESEFQRDLKDSCMLRYMGDLYGKIALVFVYVKKETDKLNPNKVTISHDCENRYETLMGIVQTYLRYIGFERPYETVKKHFRGRSMVTQEEFYEFIRSLDIDEKHKKYLCTLTVENCLEI